MQELSLRGPDGAAIWQRGAVGLGCQMLHTTPESRQEKLPWQHPLAELVITADARLDNRVELMQALHVPQQERSVCTDSQLILLSYEKWGENCPQYLLGDFAFAIWDGQRQRLFCCRDHLGKRPLFYFHDGRWFLFASEAKGILAVSTVARRLNRQKLAALAVPGARLHLHEQTFYEQIFSLPAATSLSLDRNGLRKQTYWEPDATARLPFKRAEEVLDALRELLFTAVSAQLRSAFPVAALLSGGLDSSALVSVAARILAERGQTLTTFSSVLPVGHRAGLKDERDFIEEFRGWPNLDLRYITAPGRGPLNDLEKVVWSYESPLLISRHYLYTAFAAAAREAGMRVLLDGAGGEFGPTFYGDGYYAELLLRLRWPTLWRELRARRQVYQLPYRALVGGHLLAYLIPPGWQKKQARPEEQILQPAFVRQHFDRASSEWLEAEKKLMRSWPDQRRNQQRMILALCRKHARFGAFVNYETLDIRQPFLDKRLLEFCLAVPGDLKVRDGYARYLIRAGLDGILPPAIQWRTSKLPFSPDYADRFAAQREQVATFLAAIMPGDPVREVVDVERLKTLCASTETRAGSDQAALHQVPFGIYLITFLRQFAEFKTANALSLSNLRTTVGEPARLAEFAAGPA